MKIFFLSSHGRTREWTIKNWQSITEADWVLKPVGRSICDLSDRPLLIFKLICIYTLLTISPLKNLYTRLLELSFVSDFLRVTRCVFDKKQELLSFGEHLACRSICDLSDRPLFINMLSMCAPDIAQMPVWPVRLWFRDTCNIGYKAQN
jgi:hypothetical protein